MNPNPPLRLGLLGLDTSHVQIFAHHFNDPAAPHHLPGATIVAAWPGGSPDLPASRDRVAGYTAELRDRHGVAILDSPEAVAAACDAILLCSVDGRVHRAQFERIAPLGKPVFVDKPFATTTADARAIVECAARHGVRFFTSSSLRFSAALTRILPAGQRALGADFSGPLALEPTNPGWFWYGIHAVEMLFTALGPGCQAVSAWATEQHDVAVGRWTDGRLGTVRGNRTGNHQFHGIVHFADQSRHVDVPAEPTSFFTSLAIEVLKFFQGGPCPVPPAESVEIVRFIEAANASRAAGGAEIAL